MNQPVLPRWKYALLVLISLAMIGSFAMMTRLDHFTRLAYEYLSYFGAAFVLYLLAMILLWRVELTDRRHLLIGIFAIALLMRAPLWVSQPSLSTDVWRYLWDGQLLNQGINPYAERVDSPALDAFDGPLRSRVQHQWMASPYPPAAQLAFGGVYRLLPDSASAMQVVFSLFDLAAGAVLIVLLKRLRRPTGRALLYLWNPLIVVEFAHSAHLDSLVTLLVLLALLWTIEGRQTASTIALALATLTKFIPILLLPAFVRRWGWRRGLLFGGFVALGFLPFIGAGLGLNSSADGTGIFGAARIYSLVWKTNDGLFFWLVRGLEKIGVEGSIGLAKLITLAVLSALAVWVWLRPGSKNADSINLPVSGMALLISAYTLLSAAVFPWYLGWLLALLPLLPITRHKAWWPFILGWIYFSGAVNLSYLYYLDPVNPRELSWVRRLEYWPMFGLLVFSLAIKLWPPNQRKEQGKATLPDTNP